MTIARNSSQDTLASNTGYDSQNRSGPKKSRWSVGIDWLDFTFRRIAGSHEADELIKEFELVTGKSVEFAPGRPTFNGIQWDGSGSGQDGIMIWYRAPHEDDFGECQPAKLKIALPGRALAGVDLYALGQWLVMAGDSRELDCTRMDICLDDHDKIIKLRRINEARELGHFFNASYSERIESCKRGEIIGVTLYFGSKSSDKRLRIYDKTIESKGKTQGNRWEAQFRRKMAYQAFSQWLETVPRGSAAVSRLLQNIVLGVIDFRERGDDDADRTRCPRCAWYSFLLEHLGSNPARIVVKKIQQTAQRSVNWIRKSVAPTLLSLRSILGDDFKIFLKASINEAAQKLTKEKRMIINTTDKQELLY